MSAPLRLYDLAAADASVRFSPNCWRTRLALAHKGLAVETITWRFTEKEEIAATGQGKVPVLVDGDRWVHDSWTIAEYLENTYADRPSLFGSPEGRGLARFVNDWTSAVLHPALARILVPLILPIVHEKDRAYFRASREAAFGCTLEALAAKREEALETLARTLAPLRATLAAQPYVSGSAPAYADYAVFGAFQWARVVTAMPMSGADDSICAWSERMLDACGGLARTARLAHAG